MKQSFIVLAALVASWMNVQGQSATSSNVVGRVPGQQIDVKVNTQSIVSELPVKKGEPEGDVYLNSEWIFADLTLSNKGETLTGLPIKLNLQRIEFEINVNNQTKILPGRRVSEFVLHQTNGATDKYINGNGYKLDGVPVTGFLRVIDGKKNEGQTNAASTWQLYARQQLKVIESNYNAALASGNRSDKFVKTEKILLGKGDQLYETKVSRKNLVKTFAGNEQKVEKFMKENKLNPKKLEDLLVLLTFLNNNQI